MNTETLKKILNEKSVSFTQDELKKFVDDELEKSEEVDVELIEQCLDLLEKCENGHSDNKKKRRLKLNRVLLIAAIIVILFGVAIPVGAKFFHNETAKNVVEYCNDYFKVDMSEENLNEDTVKLKSQAQDAGIDNLALPTALFDDCDVSNLSLRKLDDLWNKINVDFFGDDIVCNVSVNFYDKVKIDSYDFGKFIVPDSCENFKQFTVKSFDILVYSEKNTSSIYYRTDNTEYRLSLNCDFNTAVSLAKTINYV